MNNNDEIDKHTFYAIVNGDIDCCIESCRKSMCNFNFAYIQHNLYFCEKPWILCPECFNKKECDTNYIPKQYKHLPKYIWDPPWIKVNIEK